MSSELPVVSSLWVGGRLSYLELVSLRSMMRWGHRVKLYHYKPLENAPDWLETHDANEIYPVSDERLERFSNSLSIIANIFRIHLMAKTEEVWSDCDVYFLRPLLKRDYLFATERLKPVHGWNNSLLRLPSDSAIVKSLLEFVSTDYPVLPIHRTFSNIRRNIPILKEKGGNGKVHLTDLAWGTTGPAVLSYYIHRHKLQKFGWPIHMHQPIGENQKHMFVRTVVGKDMAFHHTTQSVHFFGSSLRRLLISRPIFKSNEPTAGSFLQNCLVDQQVNPQEYPLLSAVDKRSHDGTGK